MFFVKVGHFKFNIDYSLIGRFKIVCQCHENEIFGSYF